MIKKNLKLLLPPIFFDVYSILKYKFIYLKYRKYFIKNKPLKDSMIDQRCFILGSGHSIDSVDINRFKNENIIGLNSFMFHKDYKSITSPGLNGVKYHVLTALHEFPYPNVHNAYIDELDANLSNGVKYFFGIDDFKFNYIDEFKKKKSSDQPNRHYIHCNIVPEKKDNITDASYDCSKTTWAHKTSSNMALFLALYLGFKDIYLLGVDHNHMYADPNNVKAIKSGIVSESETILLKELHTKGKGSQVSHFNDLIGVIRPMELIEDRFPLKVKNLSKKSVFYCHQIVDIESLGI